MKKLFILIFLLVVGALVYAKRAEIKDWIAESQKPDVEEVAYEDVVVDDVANELPADDIGGATTPRDEQPADAVEEPTEERGTVTPPIDDEETSTLPTEFNLAIPFTSQAPKSNWDEVHQETCEEASVLMASYYFAGKPAGKIDPDEADTALLQIVDFENSFFGFYKDTTAEQTGALAEAMFNLTYDLIQNPTVEQIKQALVDGHPVIIPAAGRQLGNPNFTGLGPLYHMFIIKGYTADGFITNDPGTRLGADYFYSTEVVMNAIHDWNDGDVGNGAKVVLVIKP